MSISHAVGCCSAPRRTRSDGVGVPMPPALGDEVRRVRATKGELAGLQARRGFVFYAPTAANDETVLAVMSEARNVRDIQARGRDLGT